MANSDAKPVPRKNEPYRLGFCLRLDTVSINVFQTSCVAPAAYVSLDGSGFCSGNDSLYFSGPPIEIDSVGIGYVDITSSGMNADLVLVRICDNSGVALTSQSNFFTALYPEEPGDYRCDVVQVSGENVDIGSFGGDSGGGATPQQVWEYGNRTLTHLGSTAVSGDVAGSVWNALQTDYSSINNSFGDYLDYEISKTATVSELTITEGIIRNDIEAMSGSIMDANVIEIDGDVVSLVTTNEVASAVWDVSINEHSAGGSTGMALITSSGNLISGDWSTHSANDIWTQSTRDLTESVSVSGVVDANITQVSGVSITLSDLQSSSDISTSGFATRSQLEYWGLVILNNCGGGPVG